MIKKNVANQLKKLPVRACIDSFNHPYLLVNSSGHVQLFILCLESGSVGAIPTLEGAGRPTPGELRSLPLTARTKRNVVNARTAHKPQI